jgi:hypothetical protein
MAREPERARAEVLVEVLADKAARAAQLPAAVARVVKPVRRSPFPALRV